MAVAVSQTKRFSRYEIIRKLGRSMTDVYLAFDSRLERRVILKLIEESRDDHTQVVIEAEKRGARIQTDLHRLDPRVLEVYEFGTVENCFYVSMEYFEGKNIAELLQVERRFDPKRAARYAAEICSQLDRLHSFVSDVDGKRRAVVHGDIKPSNIQISRNDQLRLLDFGIAKVITYTRNLTQHNLGSPTYCSPERLAKNQVDAQADLWALGVTLYEMIAGSPPYQAQDTRKLEILIQSRRPPRSLPDDCPAALGAIITRALAGEADLRYPSAAAFEKDLRAFLDDKPTAAFARTRPSWEGNTTIQKLKSELIRIKPRAPRLRIALYQLRQRLLLLLPRFDHTLIEKLPRAGALLLGLIAVFAFAYSVGRLRDRIWSTRDPVDYTHASISEINSDWNDYLKLRDRNRFLGRFSPASFRAQEIKSSLSFAALEVVDGYRNSSDPSLASVDWAKAQVCLRHALEIDPNDRALASRLALCEGYLNLIQNPRLPRAALSEASFRKAAARLPRSSDPHLALAHLYVYSYQNIGRALAELEEAERLGFHSGPREMEERGDGYLFRAESESKRAQKTSTSSRSEAEKALRLSRADLDRARNLYEPIAGFSNVSNSIVRLDQDEIRAIKLEAALQPPAPPKPKPVQHRSKHSFSSFVSRLRWQ